MRWVAPLVSRRRATPKHRTCQHSARCSLALPPELRTSARAGVQALRPAEEPRLTVAPRATPVPRRATHMRPLLETQAREVPLGEELQAIRSYLAIQPSD